jgi:serine O-acetyltransferase
MERCVSVFKNLRYDIKSILERDPAARNGFEVFFLYSGFHALMWYRAAHFLYGLKLKFLARLFSQLGRWFTGVEIHPGAKIGRGLLIDHGMGVVIGETTVIGDNCTIYQGVTLGGTGKEKGKRHPTIGNNVMIGSGAKILGPFTVGDNSKIAAGAVVLSEVPEDSTAVGIPARVVRRAGQVVEFDLDQVKIPDPLTQQVCTLSVHVAKLEKEIKELKEGKKNNENI